MIAFGSSDMTKAYIGSTEVSKVYLGDELVWGDESPASRLPEGYTELQWISNPSTAYIVTSVNASVSSKLRIKTRWTSNTASVILCTTRSGSNGPRFSLATNAMYISSTTSDSKTISFGLTKNSIYEIEYDNGTITYHNLTSGSVTNYTFGGTGTGNVWVNFNLFRQAYGSAYNFVGDIFELEIEDGNTHAHFIPCINDVGVVGMFDIINSNFYNSANSVSFVAGDLIN